MYDRDENLIMGVLSPRPRNAFSAAPGCIRASDGNEGRRVGYWIALDAIGKGYADGLTDGPDAGRIRPRSTLDRVADSRRPG